MKSDYFNNIIKIFLFGSIIFYVIFSQNKVEKFTGKLLNSFDSLKNKSELMQSQNPNNFQMDHTYNIIKTDEIANKLVYLCKYNTQLKHAIKFQFVNIYKQIKQNDRLKTYLKFLNLVDDAGVPIFINESDDVALFNQIKILLVTLPK